MFRFLKKKAGEAPQVEVQSSVASPARPPSVLARLVNWLWLTARSRELASLAAECKPQVLEFARRARLTLAVADRLVESDASYAAGSIAPLASELYRQSTYWSLAAWSARGQPTDPDFAEQRSGDTFAELWARAESGPVADAAGGSDAAKGLWESWADASFRDPWGARSPKKKQLAVQRRFASALLRHAEPLATEVHRLWLTRLERVVLPAVLVVTALVGGGILCYFRRVSSETTIPWRASSTYSEPACKSPSQSCQNPNFFFCTNHENNPWIEFDLGEPTSVSMVHIINRTDCNGCAARAIPLVVEVSLNGKSWAEVARQAAQFKDWEAQFEPTQARWVRLRVARTTFLHLKQVRIPH
jgi:hypothetical protein